MIAVLDHRAPRDAALRLSEFGIEPILIPPHPMLPPPVASHPDLLFFFTQTAFYTVESYWKQEKELLQRISRQADLELCLCEGEVGDRYPSDILLDAAPIGEKLLCAPAHTAEELLALYGNNVIPVRQGYAKCACVPIGANALITADPSLLRGAKSVGLDHLAVLEGHVSLPGYSTGFLGGAASFCPDPTFDTVFFCGSLSRHPNGQQIVEFCDSHQRKAVSLGEFPLTDVGTIFIVR